MFRRSLFAILALLAGPAHVAANAAEITVQPVDVVDMKSVFGRVETRVVVPARARIGGTLVELLVQEGSAVTQGQPVARVVDDKLALQRNAADARIKAVESDLANARTELARARELLARGAGTQQRVDQLRAQSETLQAQVNAARADRSVIEQQSTEGAVLAPTTGRVLKTPLSKGAVVMPGDPIAMVAGGGFFLRLAIPERHAPALKVGARVVVVGRAGDAEGKAGADGKIVKVFPQIENGRVIADVEAPEIGDFFVDERILVRVPVATRSAIAIPKEAMTTRAGLDFVRVATPAGPREIAVVPGGLVETPAGERLEILSGLRAGDVVVTP